MPASSRTMISTPAIITGRRPKRAESMPIQAELNVPAKYARNTRLVVNWLSPYGAAIRR